MRPTAIPSRAPNSSNTPTSRPYLPFPTPPLTSPPSTLVTLRPTGACPPLCPSTLPHPAPAPLPSHRPTPTPDSSPSAPSHAPSPSLPAERSRGRARHARPTSFPANQRSPSRAGRSPGGTRGRSRRARAAGAGAARRTLGEPRNQEGGAPDVSHLAQVLELKFVRGV